VRLKLIYGGQNLTLVPAVTLEGTVIHKSGLITGGRSTHGSGKKWEEAEVQSAFSGRPLASSWRL